MSLSRPAAHRHPSTPTVIASATLSALALYALQPLPALVMASQLANDASLLTPTWGNPWWIGAACVFGVVLGIGAGALGAIQSLRGRTWLIASSVLAYLAVPAAGVAMGTADIIEAINWVSVFFGLSFTYSLSGWISLLVATTFTLVLASRPGSRPHQASAKL